MAVRAVFVATLLALGARGQMIGDKWKEEVAKCPFADFQRMSETVDKHCCPSAGGTKVNVCRCVDGTPKAGSACPADGAKACLKCNEGYALNIMHTACEEKGAKVFEARLGAVPKKGVTVATYEFKLMTLTNRKGAYSTRMREACKLYRMKPICDHPGYCKNDAGAIYLGQQSHISHPSYRFRKNTKAIVWNPQGFADIAHKWDGLCVYTGNANGNNALCNTPKNGHSWKNPNNYKSPGFMCGRVKGASSSSIVVSLGAHHGVPARTYEFRKSMPDPKSKKSFSAQMVEGCNKMGMKPVCNHPSYCRTDPHAIYIGQDSHLSVGPYNRNPKMVPKRFEHYAKYFDSTCSYCNKANKGLALCSNGNSHGWYSPSNRKSNNGFWCARIKSKAKSPDTPCQHGQPPDKCTMRCAEAAVPFYDKCRETIDMIFDESDHTYDGHADNFEYLTDICLDEEMVNVETLLGRAQELRDAGCTVDLGVKKKGGHRRRAQISIGVKNAGKCGTIAVLQKRINAVNKACCSNKKDCPKGFPHTCNLECAIVFDPFFRDCRSIIMGNDEQMAVTLHHVAEECVKQDTSFIVRAIGAAQCPAGVDHASSRGAAGGGGGGSKPVSLVHACVTSNSFVVVGSTSINKDSTARRPRWFELSEVKLFNEAGVNIAKQAKVEIIKQPKNPQDLAHITDGKFWKVDKGSKFVVWDESTKFHGAALIKLTFPTPQKVIGAELYSTNYESFGTNARVVGVPQSGGVTASKSIPVRTVFLAHGDEEQCFEHNKITAHPCSTEDGKPVYAEAASCTAFKRGVTKTFSLTSSSQDAEMDAVSGHMYLTSSDLEFCSDVHGHVVNKVRDTGDQLVLINFPKVSIPHGAIVTSAKIVFQVDEVHPGQSDKPVEVAIFGIAGPSTAPTTKAFDISARKRTRASASWKPESSKKVGDPLVTGDISQVVQEVVGTSSWKPGSSLGIQLSHASGKGIRWAESFQKFDKKHCSSSICPKATPALIVTYSY